MPHGLEEEERKKKKKKKKKRRKNTSAITIDWPRESDEGHSEQMIIMCTFVVTIVQLSDDKTNEKTRELTRAQKTSHQH